MPRCAPLSSAARSLLTRLMSGEEAEGRDSILCQLERAGLLGPDGRPTIEAWARRREFLPHGGPLSAEAVALLRRIVAGKVELSDENRAAHRELAMAGIMMACHIFARGDESLYRFTAEGWERRAEWLGDPDAPA